VQPDPTRKHLAKPQTEFWHAPGGAPRVLSPRMVQFGHAVLRNALSSAVREELVTRNVAKLVRVSTPHYEVGQGLDPMTARTFLESIREDRLYALYLCAVVLGLRRSELLGLAGSVVDLAVGRHTCVAIASARSRATHRARDRRPLRHQGHDDRLRPRQS
jgi:integrase